MRFFSNRVFLGSRTRMNSVDFQSQAGESVSTGAGLSSVYAASEAKVGKSISIIELQSRRIAHMPETVWVYPERTFEKLGAVRYHVSWEQVKKSAEARLERDNDFDPDSDIDYLFVNCPTQDAAMQRAREIVKSGVTAFGAVTITRQIVDWYVEEDRIAEWVDSSEREEVSG
jgi:hypothetical protein